MNDLLVNEDRYALACNYAEGTNVASKGAKAYVVTLYLGGNLPERLMVRVRSHGGRWVEKWENTGRLTDFRVVTVPPEHPMYAFDGKWVAVSTREDAVRNLDILRRHGIEVDR